MEATVLKYVLPGILGFVGGVVGSLVAPWVRWGVEKRRLRQTKRQELINGCRMLLTTDIDKKTFRESDLYTKIRIHLYARVIEAIEKDDPPEPAPDGTEPAPDFRQVVLEDIARIEKEWVLI